MEGRRYLSGWHFVTGAEFLFPPTREQEGQDRGHAEDRKQVHGFVDSLRIGAVGTTRQEMVGGEGCPPPGDPDRFYGDPPIGGDGKFGPTREREVREGVEWIMGVDEQ